MSEYSPTRKGDGLKAPEDYEDPGSQPLIGTKSPGVARIEALSKQITTGNRIAIFIGVFFIAYAYGLVSRFTIRIL
jgi:SIT family siderophore-iron:H+ symporter-like MFS transporter